MPVQPPDQSQDLKDSNEISSTLFGPECTQEVPEDSSEFWSSSATQEVQGSYSSCKAKSQLEVQVDISNLNRDIVYLSGKQNLTQPERKQLEDSRKKLKEKENRLKSLQSNQRRQKRSRDKLKKRILANPEVAAVLKKKPMIGRPRLEDDQEGLLDAIVSIATYGSGADSRRRTDQLRTIKTLDQLTEQLQLNGFRVTT